MNNPTAPTRTVVDVVTDFLATNPTPEQIIDYELPTDLQQRITWLQDRNSEGNITPDEKDELADIVRIDDMFSMLKAKSQLKRLEE